MENIKFIADCMLGKLARWLRILGFDTQYARFLSDPQLLAQARFQGRILLTKDKELFQKGKEFAYFVRSDIIEEQINEILTHYHLHPNENLTRCPHCNVLLKKVKRKNLTPMAPLYVLHSFSHNMKVCPKCGRFYWPGTHWNNIVNKLESINHHFNTSDEEGFPQ